MKMMLLAILFALFSVATDGQETWPQWRGPMGNGVAVDADYPHSFSNKKKVRWKAELPGRGSSTPAVWGDRIFVTCAIDGEDGVVCYDFDGTEQWRKKLGKERVGKHRNASGSNASPVVTKDFVVVYYKSATLACLDHQGNVQWQNNLVEAYGPDTLWWDRGTSPVLAAGNVVVAVMQQDNSYLVSFDLRSGDELWKQPRNVDSPGESSHSYATPAVARQDGRDIVVCWGADHLTGHDAQTGKPLWQQGGFNPQQESNWRAIASAPVDDRFAFVPYGRGDFLAAVSVSPADEQDSTGRHVWQKEGIGADVPTPIVHGNHLIVLTDEGEVACLDKASGEERWKASLPRGRANYFASPVVAGDTLYCAREDGVIMSARVDGGLKDVVENKMKEPIIATPVPIRGGLLVRGKKHLFWIKEGEGR